MAGLRHRRIGRRAALATLTGAAACAGRPGLLSYPVPLPPERPNLPLRPLGVLRIDAGQLGADGLSGLHVGPDLTLTTVSDRSRWARARLVLAADGTPLGLEAARSGPLRDTAGRAMPREMVGDAESLARLPDGTWLVGYEREHRIWRYRDLDSAAEPMQNPPGIEAAAANGSLEAVGVLADGRWLVIAESLPPSEEDPGARMAWIGGPGRWHRFAYRPRPWHNPSDLCPLPDGGALVLERHFTWTEGFSASIARLPPPPAAPTLLQGTEVAQLEPPLPSDNWEGISAFRHNGRDLVAVISDDNQMVPLQRTLLMVLGWADQAAA
ncbi:esterase-like activity of phytase family protein [Roseomonas populi]|uniref:Esterase-like activity of phytase family protein n=1 Tax=Roseomonas populi TaxID=3121582 RepID=A0ABT1X6V0_9PROT|nr:esterase-like activity of phytase family protein [Roseomonas pecuniae]MCR0982892.1 esterase-like activity of phytase family protein [Roseomonas pecuniae]